MEVFIIAFQLSIKLLSLLIEKESQSYIYYKEKEKVVAFHRFSTK